jgi:hypothetical protein
MVAAVWGLPAIYEHKICLKTPMISLPVKTCESLSVPVEPKKREQNGNNNPNLLKGDYASPRRSLN